jgi:site-specific recombinase XerD
MMRDAIQDRRYQSETRLGGSVASYLAWKRLSASERTLVIYEGYLARLCISLAHVDPAIDEVTPEMLLDALSEYPHGSLRLVRTAYSDFFKWAYRWGHRDRNPVDLLPPIPEPPMKVYDVFTAVEQAQLVKASDQLPLPWVQRLRVLCFVDLGIRSEEARGLQPTDFDMSSRVAVVKGKGGKERVIPFGDDLFRAFVSYRNRPIPNVRMTDEHGRYREARPPADDDYLFFPLGFVKQTGVRWADPFRPLSPRAMRSWWDKIVETAGVRYRSLHMNRHTLGTDLSTAGEDLATVQDWLGHASPETTKVYVHNSRSRLARGRGTLDAYRKAQGQ